MSLRSRLFLVFGGLLALLVGAQWWLVRTLAQELRGESDAMALSVSTSVLHFLGGESSQQSGDEPGNEIEGLEELERVVAFVINREGSEAPPWAGEGGMEGSGEIFEENGPIDFVKVTQDPMALLDELEPEIGGRVELVLGVGNGTLSIESKFTDEEGYFRTPAFEEALESGTRFSTTRIVKKAWTTTEVPPPLAPPEVPHALQRLDAQRRFHDAVRWQEGSPQGLGELAPGEALTFDAKGLRLPSGVELPSGGLFSFQARSESPRGYAALTSAEPSKTTVRQIPIPSQGIDTALDTFSANLLAGSGAILLLGLFIAGFVAHRVSSPLRELARAANDLGQGDLGRTVPETGDPEVSRTIGAFNSMSLRLADLDAEARSLRERRHLSELGEVARGFAHTLRNPLNVLGLTLDELARADETPRAAELHEVGRAQIRRVDQAVRGFLALASSDANHVEEVRLEDTAQDVALELLQSGLGDVDVTVDAEAGVTVMGIAAELRAVIHSLVVNAVEASPDGETVGILVSRGEDAACVTVLDRGEGLPQKVRERLFTPHLTTKEHGAGMGLFLAQRLAIGRYRGSLELVDRPGGGTRAVLELRAREDADHVS